MEKISENESHLICVLIYDIHCIVAVEIWTFMPVRMIFKGKPSTLDFNLLSEVTAYKTNKHNSSLVSLVLTINGLNIHHTS